MWISSFVVTLPEAESAAMQVIQHLAARPELELGTRHGRRLPVVLECADALAARECHAWVESLPGVVCVDLALVSFEPADSPASAEVPADAAPPHGGVS